MTNTKDIKIPLIRLINNNEDPYVYILKNKNEIWKISYHTWRNAQPSNLNNCNGDTPDEAAKNGLELKTFIRRVRHDSRLSKESDSWWKKYIWSVLCDLCGFWMAWRCPPTLSGWETTNSVYLLDEELKNFKTGREI